MLDPVIRDLAATGQNFATVCVILPNGRIAGHVIAEVAPERQRVNNL